MNHQLSAVQPLAPARLACRRVARRQASKPAVAAMPNTSLVICATTAASLALGRFVFLPFQRDQQERAGQQQQGGEGGEGGDRLIQVQPLAIQTNDPAGFTLVDVLAWGSIGHAIAYFILATSSLQNAGIDPKPKFF